MVYEKQAAFTQACAEMALQMFCVNLQLASAVFWTVFTPSSLTAPSMAAAVAQSRQAAESVLGKGLAPIHRTALLNARRLSKIPLC
jgi:hypothetical protein